MVKIDEIKGITLVSLVVTIIVLIILAGVSINLLVGDKGIVTKAKEGRDKYANASVYEQEQLTTITEYADSITSGGGEETGEIISKQESFVGCYADLDRNGTIDGIIYADLLARKPDDGEWGNEDYNHDYSLPTDVTTSNVKQYVKSATARTDARFDNTPRYVISPSRGNSGTKDRFYVMALNDFTSGTYNVFTWYKSVWTDRYTYQGTMSDYETCTSQDFGAGKANTTTMLAKWNASAYGVQNDTDLWKWLDIGENGANKGWFVPSDAEWTAFNCALNITGDNYTNYHMNSAYWTSAQFCRFAAGMLWYDLEYFWRPDAIDARFYVRLSTTF